jgi:ubiquinone biosynthesis protein COQ4
MLKDRTGRRILREKPLIDSTTLSWDKLRELPDGSFGRAYMHFMDQQKISADARVPIQYIQDPELAYIMLRYRQVHDFWHVLYGLDAINLEAELALKVIDAVQTGLPMALLASVVGPFRMPSSRRTEYYKKLVPWALQAGSSSAHMMNVYYEDEFEKPLNQLREELGILLPPVSFNEVPLE